MAVLEKEVGGGVADECAQARAVRCSGGCMKEPWSSVGACGEKKVLRCIFCWRISNPPKMFHLALSTITQPNYSFQKRWCTIVAHRAIQ